MRDWQAGRLRYLVHFSDGGSGMRHRDTQLDVGDELREGSQRSTVDRVEPPANPNAFGNVWATLVERWGDEKKASATLATSEGMAVEE